MRYDIRPLVAWTDPETPQRRSSSRFKASWADTLDFLSTEIGKVGGKEPVVLQVDVTEGDIRLDGMLRANAKVGHPGVVVSFDSDFGPLRYATDAYEKDWSHGMPSWQANIRAIALDPGSAARDRPVGREQARRAIHRLERLSRRGGSVTFPSADEALRWMQEKPVDRRQTCGSARLSSTGHSAASSTPTLTATRTSGSDCGAARLLLMNAGMF